MSSRACSVVGALSTNDALKLLEMHVKTETYPRVSKLDFVLERLPQLLGVLVALPLYISENLHRASRVKLLRLLPSDKTMSAEDPT